MLLNKPFDRAHSPRFLPVRYQPKPVGERLSVDFFHCPQCPFSGWALERLRRMASGRQDIDLTVVETAEREQIEAWGIAQGVFVDGRPILGFPINPAHLERAVDRALAAKSAAALRT